MIEHNSQTIFKRYSNLAFAVTVCTVVLKAFLPTKGILVLHTVSWVEFSQGWRQRRGSKELIWEMIPRHRNGKEGKPVMSMSFSWSLS